MCGVRARERGHRLDWVGSRRRLCLGPGAGVFGIDFAGRGLVALLSARGRVSLPGRGGGEGYRMLLVALTFVDLGVNMIVPE